MPEKIVINTGPLITLARIEALDIIGKLPFEFISPIEVQSELDAGVEAGHPAVNPSWLKILELKNPMSPITLSAIDKGEAAVIQLALEQHIQWACIDEWKARRVAQNVGLQVVGVPGLLGKAKKLGLISELKPMVERRTRSSKGNSLPSRACKQGSQNSRRIIFPSRGSKCRICTPCCP